ncbi:hypothetical protein [Streptomyces sp. WG-D5]
MAETPTPAEAAPGSEPVTEGQSSPAENSGANREAAKYRTKLREAEAKLEAAESRVTALLRKEIEAHASKRLAVGADLFDLGGASVDDLTDPEMNVSTDAVDAAVAALLAKRPGLRSNTAPWGDVGGGRGAGTPEREAPTMLDALKNAKR